METEPGIEPPRPPRRNDLISICRALNEQNALYIVVGGMAVIQQGLTRATDDVDLLLEPSSENIQRVRQALEILPDKAIREMTTEDLQSYMVVRIADEIIIDLMLKTCGISYDEAKSEVEFVEVRGTSIPFASARLLLKMKQSGREKDELDRRFLEDKLRRQKK